MAGIQSVTSNYSNNIYGNIASGNRINKASDDAAGLAINEKMKSQVSGLDQGKANSDEGVKALNIADGAMGQATDSLQRVYELSVKAANTFMYGEEERKAMQDEASSLLKDIDTMAKNTTYNEQQITNGGDSIHIASNPDGSGTDIKKANISLEALGLKDFDINSPDAISKVSEAIKNISGQRADGGAATAGLEYAKNYNSIASENTLSASSRLADLDIPKAVSKMKQDEILKSYQFMLQKKKQEEEEKKILGLF